MTDDNSQKQYDHNYDAVDIDPTVSDPTLDDAIIMYLGDRQPELAQSTLKGQRYRLDHLVRFGNEHDITTVGELTPVILTQFTQWRRQHDDLNLVSLNSQLTTVRVFIAWCASKGFVQGDLDQAIQIPEVGHDADRRQKRVDADVAAQILEYCDKYAFAQRPHVIMRLLWRTAMRIGALHAIDVDDYDADAQQLHVVHRPETDTPIKKQQRGERVISLQQQSCDILDDYIKLHRHAQTDAYGRTPLVTSKQGRLSTSSLRRAVYRLTQPCQVTGECPHNYEIESCEHKGYTSGSGCPSSRAPHDVRRGAITHFLSEDIPKEIVQDRCDVSPDVIDHHYDVRTDAEKAEQRRKYFD
jgi:site-specific recombinase XerC